MKKVDGKAEIPPTEHSENHVNSDESIENRNAPGANGIENVNKVIQKGISTNSNAGVKNLNPLTSVQVNISYNAPCGFKMEKSKMPDVRGYAIFRTDFRHAIDTQYRKRDAISLLRTSLQG